jgi:hypothetical protein
MWAVVYFRELPVPLRRIDENLLEIIFKFANTFTEESVLQGYTKRIKEAESEPTAELMKELGYSDEDIAEMDIK